MSYESPTSKYDKVMYGVSGDIAHSIFSERDNGYLLKFNTFVESLARDFSYLPSMPSSKERNPNQADFLRALKELPQAVRDNLRANITRSKSNEAQIVAFQKAINALTDAVTERLHNEGSTEVALAYPLLAEDGEKSEEVKKNISA